MVLIAVWQLWIRCQCLPRCPRLAVRFRFQPRFARPQGRGDGEDEESDENGDDMISRAPWVRQKLADLSVLALASRLLKNPLCWQIPRWPRMPGVLWFRFYLFWRWMCPWSIDI